MTDYASTHAGWYMVGVASGICGSLDLAQGGSCAKMEVPADLSNVASHSRKATVLSWMNKSGLYARRSWRTLTSYVARQFSGQPSFQFQWLEERVSTISLVPLRSTEIPLQNLIWPATTHQKAGSY